MKGRAADQFGGFDFTIAAEKSGRWQVRFAGTAGATGQQGCTSPTSHHVKVS